MPLILLYRPKNSEVIVSCGVPQESVLGPTLWNILYDEAQEIVMTIGIRLDDMALEPEKDSVRYLGIPLDKTMTFIKHIKEVPVKTSKLARVLTSPKKSF